jgi:hypothetical protein
MLSILAIIPIFNLPIVEAMNETVNIEAADASINQAFTNILAAEKAGGNVTQLLIKLNTAGTLLAEAENYYKAGYLINVTSVADNARLIANQVNSDALGLRNLSISQSQNNSLFTIVFSIMSTIAFIVVMFLIWRGYKRVSYRKLLNSKPLAK